MAFNLNNWLPISAQANSNAPRLFTYETADTLSQVSAADYFLQVINQVDSGDLFYIVCSDGNFFGAVSVVGSSITWNENGGTRSEEVFSQSEATLSNGASIDTGFIDMDAFSKYQISYIGSAALSLSIESRATSTGAAELTTPAPYTGVFYLADLVPRQRYVRLILTNSSGVDVTSVNMAVKAIYGGVEGTSVFPIEISPSQFSPAMLTQSVLIGKDAFGVYKNTEVNEAGALLTAEFGTEVARGVYPAYEVRLCFGRNPDIDTGTAPEDMWNSNGTYTGFNATANENIEVFSGSGNDVGALVSSGTATGGTNTTILDSGATFVTDGVAVGDVVLNDTQGFYGLVKTVDSETQLTVWHFNNGDSSEHIPASGDAYRVATDSGTGAAVIILFELLDEDFTEQTNAFVILNGATGVTLTGNYIRAPQARIIKAGSGGVNAGVITGRQATTTANVFFNMPVGFGKTTTGVKTIPVGKFAIIKRTQASIIRANGSAGSATITLKSREVGSGAWAAIRPMEVSTGLGFSETDIGGEIINSGTDVKFTVEQVSDNGTIAEAELEYYLIEESFS